MRALQIDPADSVATLIDPVSAGDRVVLRGRAIVARDAIARGHKIALADIAVGADVIKYGVPIGHATRAVAAGGHVHTHNLATNLAGTLDYRYRPTTPIAASGDLPTFQGYRRADGRAATRNRNLDPADVGCVGRTAQRIAARSAERHAGAVDGVLAFTHPFGCSQLGDDLAATRAILADLACHPNAGGVVIVGLGCESNQLDALLAELPPERRSLIRTLVAQSSADEVEEGVALVDELVAQAATAKRAPAPLSELVLGVKCGGSDGFPG